MAQTPRADLDEFELTLLEAKVEDMRRVGLQSAYATLGRELRPYVASVPSAVPAPFRTLVEAQETARAPSRFRAAEMADSDIGLQFWALYRRKSREELCSSEGELHKLFLSKGHVSTRAIIAGVATTVGVGTPFAGVLCALVAILLEVGLNAFCEWTDAPEGRLCAKECFRRRCQSNWLEPGRSGAWPLGIHNPFRYFNSSPEVIRLTVMMYVCVAQLAGPALAHDSLGNTHQDQCGL
jgi:hypothetical protein